MAEHPDGPPELAEVLELAAEAGSALDCRVVCEVRCGPRVFPVHVLTLGNPDPAVPAVGVFGGVHGLERIGAEVALSCLRSLVSRLRWDDSLHRMLDGIRLVFMPLVNPGGLWRGTRANPQGVDLMRNSPVESEHGPPWLLGGQRIGPGLPWYRGVAGAPMEAEAQALCDVVERELMPHAFALCIDCHSGFGLTDRLWFPHAHTARPVEHLPELHALGTLLDQTLLHHRYVFEPQSLQYLSHGDLWDHLYLRSLDAGGGVLLPLTLEMGSWLWVKKNPRQMFSRHGIFNPLIEHRRQRVLRRHVGLLDFLMRAAYSHGRWRPSGPDRPALRERALARWYRQRPGR
ncbi:M14 family zinc carboxypeptidase [Ideonella sp. A 288]|uniref:M14 family zinc carboxypeptidase n=1 Tax=Ideonella sp. A 288 TaxID=1962181 RepID=UPI000B4BED30|nr:M14 family zinc carboxypeptidase [Ideonella sp. A 288]